MKIYKKLFWTRLQGFVLLPTIALRDTYVTRRIEEPQFEKPIGNLSFHIGREAVLGCSIVNLGSHKVGWLRAEDQTILTIHDRPVIGVRYSVTLDSPRTWQLRIRPVRAEDRGCYMCQINTQPSMMQIGCMDVFVPPDIMNEETSADATAAEMTNITLSCRASGHPPPKITWRRESQEPLMIKRPGAKEFYKVDSYVGSSLPMWRVDRKQMGAFLCIASNDVPPAVSKRITLRVNFAPTVIVPNQLLGAPLGTDVVLECTVEAYPTSINYWLKNRVEMLLDGPKYIISEEKMSYKSAMKLIIREFARSDIGTYNCMSTNSLGKSEGTLRLYVDVSRSGVLQPPAGVLRSPTGVLQPPAPCGKGFTYYFPAHVREKIKLYPGSQASEVGIGGLTEGSGRQKNNSLGNLLMYNIAFIFSTQMLLFYNFFFIN